MLCLLSVFGSWQNNSRVNLIITTSILYLNCMDCLLSVIMLDFILSYVAYHVKCLHSECDLLWSTVLCNNSCCMIAYQAILNGFQMGSGGSTACNKINYEYNCNEHSKYVSCLLKC